MSCRGLLKRMIVAVHSCAMMERALGADGFRVFQDERGVADTYSLIAVQADAILWMTLGQLVSYIFVIGVVAAPLVSIASIGFAGPSTASLAAARAVSFMCSAARCRAGRRRNPWRL